jgi:hypothetical protein
MKGTKGIVTSLHGVVDGAIFSARNSSNETFAQLRIVSVDIENDVAVLSSPELNRLEATGIEKSSSNYSNSYLVVGHPAGISLFKKPVTIDKSLVPLSDLIPPSSMGAFHTRKSPELTKMVISINSGNLIHGNSGSPLITNKNRIIGIVGGGLMGGTAGISWAVPIDRLQLVPVSFAKNRLRELLVKGTTELFSYENDDHEKEERARLLKRVNESFGDLSDQAISEVPKLRLGNSRTVFLAPRGVFALKPFRSIPLKLYINYNGKLVVSTIIRGLDGKPIAVIEDNEWTLYDRENYEYNNDEKAFEVVSKGDRKVMFQIEYKDGIASLFGLFVNEVGAGIYICGGEKNNLTGAIDTMGRVISNTNTLGGVITIVFPPGEYAFSYDLATRNDIPPNTTPKNYGTIPIPNVNHLFKYPRERYFGVREDGRNKYPF